MGGRIGCHLSLVEKVHAVVCLRYKLCVGGGIRAPFAVPGPGMDAGGQMLRMEQTIRYENDDRDVKDQYFTLADGTGTKWLAHRYVFVRRP